MDNQEQDLDIRTKQAELDKLVLKLEKLRLENDELRSRPAKYIRRFQPFFALVMTGIVPVILSYIVTTTTIQWRIAEYQHIEERDIERLIKHIEATDRQERSKIAAQELSFYGERGMNRVLKVDFQNDTALYTNVILVFQYIGEPARTHLIRAFKNKNSIIRNAARDAIAFINESRFKRGEPPLEHHEFVQILINNKEDEDIRLTAAYLIIPWKGIVQYKDQFSRILQDNNVPSLRKYLASYADDLVVGLNCDEIIKIYMSGKISDVEDEFNKLLQRILDKRPDCRITIP
jgi:hypothetical protein